MLGPADHGNTLSVSIPEQSPLRVILGNSLTIPCYFIDSLDHVTTALYAPPLTPRIRWSRLSNGKEVVLLVATEGQVRINTEYKEVVSLPNYPAIPTDATLEIKALRSNDTGIYRCEVMHGIEDSQDTIEVIVKGEVITSMFLLGDSVDAYVDLTGEKEAGRNLTRCSVSRSGGILPFP